jgi:F0F1-type ATP synthase assembly protein I
MLRPMAPAAREPFPPIEAGALLVGFTLLVIGLGVLIGWIAGSAITGLVVGAVLGIPAGIFVIYRRYRTYFS